MLHNSKGLNKNYMWDVIGAEHQVSQASIDLLCVKVDSVHRQPQLWDWRSHLDVSPTEDEQNQLFVGST